MVFYLAAILLVIVGAAHSVVCATFAVSGLTALIASRGRHLSWIVFLAVAALALYGAAI